MTNKVYKSTRDTDNLSVRQLFENMLLDNFSDIIIISHDNSIFDAAKYELNGHSIVFCQPDWRDYYLYDVTVDNIGGYLIDTSKINYKDKMENIIENIKRRCL
jgi:hypothetical protein